MRSGTQNHQLTMTDPRKQAPRNFVYTINNYDESVIEELHKDWYESGKVAYIVSSYEVGANGTPHIQGYCELTKPPIKFNALKKVPLFVTAHIEKRQGTAQQASDYCEKTEDPTYRGPCYKAGEMSKQGKRNDLEEVYDAVKAGKRQREIIEEFPVAYIKFHKGIDAMRRSLTLPRSSETPKEVIVYYGGTGLGKTRKAVSEYPEAHLQGPGMDQWWEGYDGHKVVILDEYRGQFPFGKLLSILDRYACKVPNKGGCSELLADKIILTMPEHPRHLYPNLAAEVREGKLNQLKRRINKIYKFSGTDPANPILTDVTGRPWES